MGGVEKKFIDVLKIFSDSAETIDVVIEEYPTDDTNLLPDIPPSVVALTDLYIW